MQEFLDTDAIKDIFGYRPKANRMWLPLARGACKVLGILESRNWRRQCAYNVLSIHHDLEEPILKWLRQKDVFQKLGYMPPNRAN